jgi:hypothetical protein
VHPFKRAEVIVWIAAIACAHPSDSSDNCTVLMSDDPGKLLLLGCLFASIE